jgi:hypothetical protein
VISLVQPSSGSGPLWIRYHRLDLVGIAALQAGAVDSCHYVIVGLSCLNAIVGVRGIGIERRIDRVIRSALLRATIDVIAGDSAARARGPVQIHPMLRGCNPGTADGLGHALVALPQSWAELREYEED